MLLSKNLVPIREAAMRRIDETAGQMQLRHKTPGVDYATKRAQAEAVTANPEIDPEKVPYIAGAADLEGIPLLDMAEFIIAKAEQKDALCAAIDIARLAAKKAVRAATTPAEIEAASAAFVAALA